MKRTTIFADEELLKNIKNIAQEKGISFAEAIRQALEQFVFQRKKGTKQLSFLAIGRSGKRNLSKDHEDLLWKKTDKELEQNI